MSRNNTSLTSLLRDDNDIVQRIHRIAKEVKKDNSKIKNISEKYNAKYKDTINEGTIRKRLLLEEGKKRGLSEEEVEKSSGFIPSIHTPILNWLYFFMLEEQDPQKELLRETQNEKYKNLIHENVDKIESIKNAPESLDYVYGNLTMEKFQTLKKLKRLSKGTDEHEAFQAYRKCVEMCKQHKIEFDRIPD